MRETEHALNLAENPIRLFSFFPLRKHFSSGIDIPVALSLSHFCVYTSLKRTTNELNQGGRRREKRREEKDGKEKDLDGSLSLPLSIPPLSLSLSSKLSVMPAPAVPDPLEHEVLPSLDQLPRALSLPDRAPPDDRVVVRVGHSDDALAERAGDDDGVFCGAPGGVEPVLVEEVLARGLGEELVAVVVLVVVVEVEGVLSVRVGRSCSLFSRRRFALFSERGESTLSLFSIHLTAQGPWRARSPRSGRSSTPRRRIPSSAARR